MVNMDGNAVFSSTRQALHVSFLIEIMPVVARSQMQMILERLMEEAGITPQLELHERTIDFRGLSALEVRGQCAMVVGAANGNLPLPELAAIWTRFGMRRRQADGVRALAEYLEPLMGTRHDVARLAMIWSLFAREGKRDDFSLNKIASEFDLARATLQRDRQKIAVYQKALEQRALERLDPYFKRTGLVEFSPTLQTS
jgi:hypothetical protein